MPAAEKNIRRAIAEAVILLLAGALGAAQQKPDLDPQELVRRATKNEILPFLERLRDRLNLPVVYITHDIAEVERLADQLVLMEKGRVIGAGVLFVWLAERSVEQRLRQALRAAKAAGASFGGMKMFRSMSLVARGCLVQ